MGRSKAILVVVALNTERQTERNANGHRRQRFNDWFRLLEVTGPMTLWWCNC